MGSVQTAETMRNAILGFRVSQALHVASVLGLSDLLVDEPRSIDVLAGLTSTDERTLLRLMRALAAIDVYHEEPAGVFANTDLSETLRSDHPSQLAAVATNVGSSYFWDTWSGLGESVRTGKNAFKALHGMSAWDYRATEPESGIRFDKAMAANTGAVAGAVVEAYDFSKASVVADIGSGLGGLLSAVLRSSPRASGILFDLPHTIATARESIAAAGLGDRCSFVAGSFFESVPSGADHYLLKAILHDWEDDDCIAILRQIRAAMLPDSVLLVVERIVGPPNEGAEVKFSDLNMLVMPGGMERTVDEFAALFSAAGLELAEVVTTATQFAIVEARPV